MTKDELELQLQCFRRGVEIFVRHKGEVLKIKPRVIYDWPDVSVDARILLETEENK